MGLFNFTPNDDDANNPTGSGGGSGAPNIVSVGPSAPATPSHNHAITGGSDIDDMLIDYNEEYKSSAPALFRDEIVTQTMSIISSSRKPNALLVGPAGVGKTAIVEEIARRIANQEASVPPQLGNTTIYELPIATLVAGAGIVGELENRITEIIKFAQDPGNDALLFIDEIHIITDDSNPTYSKIAQILKPALAEDTCVLLLQQRQARLSVSTMIRHSNAASHLSLSMSLQASKLAQFSMWSCPACLPIMKTR